MAATYSVSTVSLPVTRYRGGIILSSRTSQPSQIRKYIQVALAHPDHTELLPFSDIGDAKVILDEIWNVSTRLHVGLSSSFPHVPPSDIALASITRHIS